MHIEIVRGNRNQPGQLRLRSAVRFQPAAGELFYSLLGYGEGIEQHWASGRGAAGFRGAYHADFLYLFVRRPADLAGALHATRRLVQRLHERLGVLASELLLYYAGGYGFDVGLAQGLFGGFPPGPALPGHLAALTDLVLSACFEQPVPTLTDLEAGVQLARPGYHFADVVPAPYRSARPLLRAPNSQHGESRRYKVPLSASELLGLDSSQLRELAAQPRLAFSPATDYRRLAARPALGALWQLAQGQRPALAQDPDWPEAEVTTGAPARAGPASNQPFRSLHLLLLRGKQLTTRPSHYFFPKQSTSLPHDYP